MPALNRCPKVPNTDKLMPIVNNAFFIFFIKFKLN